MDNDFVDYLKVLDRKLNEYNGKEKPLGDELQIGIRLSKTDKGARTNARILAAQQGEAFDEAKTPPEELDTVEEDVIAELLNRTIEDIFGK